MIILSHDVKALCGVGKIRSMACNDRLYDIY